MSKVYHGSIEEVRNPEIRQPNRSLDYGSGFYTTTSYEQAKKWVERRMKDKGLSVGYVNVYELDDEVINDMKSLFFEKPTEEWVNFVMKTVPRGSSPTTMTSCMVLWQTIAFILSSHSMKAASSVCLLSFKS